MALQWLEMRIGEERDRRRREAEILARLGTALDEIRRILTGCLDDYNAAFGTAAAIESDSAGFTIRVQDPPAEARIVPDPALPGFHVHRGDFTLPIEIGILPGDKLFYRDLKADQYLTMDEMTRRILDRVLFPKLRE